MKNVAKFVLKIVALALATAAAVCTVVAFWDKILEGIGSVTNRLRGHKVYAQGLINGYDEEDDYADWDE